MYQAANPSGPFTKVNASPTTATAWAVTDLTNGQRYYFALTATDTSGNESDKSTPVVETTPVESAERVSGVEQLEFDRLKIKADPGQEIVVSSAVLDETAWESFSELLDLGVIAGTPFEINVDGPIGNDGVVITKTYPVALPEGMVATLAYFDEAVGDWVTVPSVVSEDRLSVSAVTDHLSIWVDLFNAVLTPEPNGLKLR